MKVITIGTTTVRDDLKATKKQLKEMFGKLLTDEQLEELDKKLNKNDNRGTKPKDKKVHVKKGNNS